MTLAIDLGGTITGEHGVGRLKKAHLPDQLGPDVLALSPADQGRPGSSGHPESRRGALSPAVLADLGVRPLLEPRGFLGRFDRRWIQSPDDSEQLGLAGRCRRPRRARLDHVGCDARWLERWLKPAVLGCLVVAALARASAACRRARLAGGGAVFGLLGDLALVLVARAGSPAGPVRCRPVAVPAAGTLAGGRRRRSGTSDRPAPGAHRPEPESSIGSLPARPVQLPARPSLLRGGHPAVRGGPLSVGFGLILVLLAVFAFGYRIVAGGHRAAGRCCPRLTCYMVALGSAVLLGVGTTRL